MNIAEKLRKLREDKGISQNKLIEELEEKQNINVAISSIRNYENTKAPRIPQGDVLLALARYYDVTLEYLIDDNITAYKKENLDIGKKIKLTDGTIEAIKILTKDFEMLFNRLMSDETTFNFMLHYFILTEFEIFSSYIDSCDLSFRYDNKKNMIMFSRANMSEYREINDTEYLVYIIDELEEKFKVIEKFVFFFMEYRYTSIPDDFFVISKNMDFKKDIKECKKRLKNIKEKAQNGVYKIAQRDSNIELVDDMVFFELSIREIEDKLDIYIKILKACLNDDFSEILSFNYVNDKIIDNVIKEYKNIKSIRTSIISKYGVEEEQTINVDGDD